MPCDAACKKVIINTGFMAALAPILAQRRVSVKHEAIALAAAASVHSRMLTAAGYIASHDDQFGGCYQAQAILGWCRGSGDDAVIKATLSSWTDAEWLAIEDLAAGITPK